MDQSRTKDGKFQLLDCMFGARTLLTSADSNNENGHPYSVQPGWTQLTLIHQFVCTDTHTHTRKRLMLLDLLLTVQDHLTEKLSWKKATEIGRKVDEFHCLRMTLLVTFVKLHTQKPRDTLVFYVFLASLFSDSKIVIRVSVTRCVCFSRHQSILHSYTRLVVFDETFLFIEYI